jgi:hypothetical protein
MLVSILCLTNALASPTNPVVVPSVEIRQGAERGRAFSMDFLQVAAQLRGSVIGETRGRRFAQVRIALESKQVGKEISDVQLG